MHVLVAMQLCDAAGAIQVPVRAGVFDTSGLGVANSTEMADGWAAHDAVRRNVMGAIADETRVTG